MSFTPATLAFAIKPAAVIVTALTIISCSPSGNPHLDMCMKITSNLLPGEVEFGEISENKGRNEMHLTLPYSSDGVDSEAVCVFGSTKKFNNNEDNPTATYHTSPQAMTLDGVEIESKDLLQASLASSKVVIKETADETKKQAAAAAEKAKETAAEAKDKATELAADAKDKATELAQDAKVKADEVAAKIKDSEVVDKAKSLADGAKDKAKTAILDGTKKIQESLEN